MAYEYNPESSRFELANPHRLENGFLAVAAIICFGHAAGALLIGRAALAHALDGGAIRQIVVAVILLLFGMLFGITALRQLRFFFGRNQPSDLAADAVEAAELRETLRQNAIGYAVPSGPIDNLLFALARDLIYAPPRTRMLAQLQFRNALGLAFLLLCFAVSMLGTSSHAVRDWLSLLYFALMAALVLLPLREGRLAGRPVSGRLVIGMIVVAVIAPVLLPWLIGSAPSPFARYIQLSAVTAVILAAALLASAALLAAVLAQQIKPARIAMAQSLQVLSMNAPPSQIFIEFDREMMRGWTEKIPNRVYLKNAPDTDGASGTFAGEALEESQPVPQDTEPLSLARCLSSPIYRWLLVLDLLATLAVAAGAGLLLNYALSASHYGALVMGASLLLIGRFAFNGGNLIWRRFEFVSRIYWLECQGNYQRARSSIGALLQDRVKTEKDLVNVETMTLRLWVAEIDSVAFGPDTRRSLMSIRGLPDEAERLSSHLAAFARQQAIVVAPQAEADLQRLNLLNQLNPATAAPLPAAAAQVLAAGGSTAAVAPPPAAAPRFCTQCGAQLPVEARFCAQCGARLLS